MGLFDLADTDPSPRRRPTDEQWASDAAALPIDSLRNVTKRWHQRAQKFGFEEPLPEEHTQAELIQFAMRCRAHHCENYYDKLPEAVDHFEAACAAMSRCKKILQTEGIPIGGVADLEGIMGRVALQLIELSPVHQLTARLKAALAASEPEQPPSDA